MKKIVVAVFIGIFILTGCSKNIKKEDSMQKIIILVNNHELIVELENNSSSNALISKLKKGSIKVECSDYGNFEKVGSLGFDLPTNDKNITTVPGDVILYQGNQITLYYDTNTWSFTKLGHIDIEKEELKEILGNGDVTLEIILKD